MHKTRSQRCATAALLLLIAVFLMAAPIRAAAQKATGDTRRIEHVVGLGTRYMLAPFGFEDAYSGSIGAEALYEIHGALAIPLRFGALLSFSGFIARAEDFGSSSMLQAGLYAGYPVVLRAVSTFELTAAPFLGYKHYLRRHEFEGSKTVAFRPVALGGIDLRVEADQFLTGLRTEYDVVFDNEILQMLGFELYAGWRL